CGFGSVSKLNFIPICLLPLIVLKGYRFKLIYIGGTVLVFMLLFLPAISNLPKFFAWISNLTFNTGIHGKTDLSMFDPSIFFQNIFIIFSKDIFLFIICLMIILVLILSLILKTEKRSEHDEVIHRNERKILFAIILTIVFQILVVAKNYLPYAQYYIVPSLMLSITGFAFLISFSLKTFKIFSNINSSKIYSGAIVIVILFSAYEINHSFDEATEFRDEACKINDLIKQHSKSDLVIPSVGTANEDCTLALCTMYGYGGSRNSIYRSFFSKKTSSNIFHNFWENKLFTLSDDTDIRKVISGTNKIVVQLMSVTSIEMIIKMLKEDFNIEVKDWKLILKNGNEESIYEIYLK
ncbi:MAG: hypothetical protein ABIY50_10055, partial [Ignavibacteria bacterium]